ncbi:UNVERIFIED_CONTAM: hypothetical protein H355_005410, partial [Colinus virginianus]
MKLFLIIADMGMLVLEVLTKPDRLPVGRVQITELAQLSPSHPISGFFTIVSPTDDKLGELQVSLVLEPLSETYKTSSSVPTTDPSSDVAPAPSQPSQRVQITPPDPEAVNSSKVLTPSGGKDRLFLQESSENTKDVSSASHHRLILPEEHLEVNPSALLDQGNKLRDAMVASVMKSSPDMETELNEVPPFVKLDGFRATAKGPKGLTSNSMPALENPHLFTSDVTGQQWDLNSDERAIQLLLGSADLSPVHFWNQPGSLLDSLSIGSDVYDSELNDPHYDQSLLESLFYTTPKSDSSLSDFLSDEDAKPSKKVSKAKTVKNADSVNAQKDSTASEKDQKVAEIKPRQLAPPDVGTEEAHVTSLSADRLALLERIHLARVIIESLRIPLDSCQITPRKKGLMGKPPKPASVNKWYYYPNVRDQMVAKGTLPLSRLCAMITMQHREEIGIQTFNLPLVPRTDSAEEFHLQSS